MSDGWAMPGPAAATGGLVLAGLLAWLVWAGLMVVRYTRTATKPPPRTPDPDTVRQTRSGSVIGCRSGGIYCWFGIPYGLAERWRAAVPFPSWAGTRPALASNDRPLQFERSGIAAKALGIPKHLRGQAIGSESCLTLSIRAPVDVPSGKPLPVMVWIPGGGNTAGREAQYDFGALVQKEPVIVVGINYRLGILGWFAHPKLPARNAVERSGNYGLLDMIAALQWVRDNIAPFGGDPANVTIFGMSTGGTNVVGLLTSPLARGLFHKAIVQSGPIWHDSLATAQNYTDDPEPGHGNSAREVVNKLLMADGLAANREEAKACQEAMSPEQLETYLRSKSATELTKPLQPNTASGIYEIPNLIQDGTVLPLLPAVEILADPERVNAVPVMTGSNRDEVKFLMMMNPEKQRHVLQLFRRARNPEVYDREAAYRSAAWRDCTVNDPAQRLTGPGRPPVFAYRFDWDEHPSNWVVDLRHLLGAGHTLETAFVSGQFEGFLEAPFFFRGDTDRPARDTLSANMMSYWTEFARSGAPGRGSRGDLPEWMPWSNEEGALKSIVFDTPAGGGIRMTNEATTSAMLKRKLAEDASLSPDERRALYFQMFAFPVNAQWNDSEYGGTARPIGGLLAYGVPGD